MRIISVLFEEIPMTVAQAIQQKIEHAFKPTFLQVENESHMHSGPKDAQSHFKLVLVTAEFEGLNKVKQHQAVYQVLADELAGPVHALALHTYTPQTWAESMTSPDSPNCMGGKG